MTSKRFIALLVLCMSLGVAMNAAPVTLEQARQAATSFVLKKQMPSRSLRVATTAPKKLKSSDAGDASAAFYVFNIGENQGFVIVSGDDRTNPILGYSDQGSFDETKMPANMKAWLDEYALQLTQLDQVPAANLSKVLAAPKAENVVDTRNSIAPLISTKWDQARPYWNKCPQVKNEDGEYEESYTGCVATAMSQIMNFHKWPTQTSQVIPSYQYGYGTGNMGEYITQTTEELPITTFDWAHMMDSYNGSEDQVYTDAVATLMLYAGHAAHMTYALTASGTSDPYIPKAFHNYLDYNAKLVYRSDYDLDTWIELVYQELAAGRPMIYNGRAGSGGGHSFICDGYEYGDYYHINWGWGGLGDGYFQLEILNPHAAGIGASTSAEGYNMDQTAVIGITPGYTGQGDDVVHVLTVYDMYYSSTNMILYRGDNNYFKFNKTYYPAVAAEDHVDDGTKYYRGIALYDSNNNFVELIAATTYASSYNSVTDKWPGGNTSTTYSFGKNLSNGTYKIVPVCKAEGTNDWVPMLESDRYFMSFVVNDTYATITQHPIVNLTATKYEFVGDHRVGSGEQCNVTIQNNSDDRFAGKLYLFVDNEQIDEYGEYTTVIETEISAHSSKVVTFNFTPQNAGTKNAKISLKDNSWSSSSVIPGTGSVTIEGATETVPMNLSVVIEATNAVDGVIYDTHARFKVDVTNNADGEYNRYLLAPLFIVDENGKGTMITYQQTTLRIPAHETVTLYYDFNNLAYGSTYALNMYGRNENEQTVNLVEKGASIYYQVQRGLVTWDGTSLVGTSGPANGNITIPSNALAARLEGLNITSVTPSGNPNTIYFIGENESIPAGLQGLNLVKGNTATSITLKDGYGYFTPQSFTAQNISYERTFTKARQAGVAENWSTIVLPFTPATCTASSNDMWVERFAQEADGEVTFSEVTGIEANVPYIIAINKSANLTGTPITWSASNVLLKPEPIAYTSGKQYLMAGTFAGQELENIYAVNPAGSHAKMASNSQSVAPFRAYFKEIETLDSHADIPLPGEESTPAVESVTLAQLVAGGDVDSEYTISDELIAVHYAVNENDNTILLWCKDQGEASIDKTYAKDGQEDYLYNDSKAQNKRDWDQSNWVVLKFVANPENMTSIPGFVRHKINKSSITGTYSDALNYTITMNEGLNASAKGEQFTYTPNVYCVANFNPENIDSDGAFTKAASHNYFFMNPKVQEVCTITYAQWNGSMFTVPSNSGFDGSLVVDYTYNNDGTGNFGFTPELETNKTYQFKAIVNRNNRNYGKAVEPNANIKVYAADLTSLSIAPIPTAISTINVERKGDNIYYNLMGQPVAHPTAGIYILNGNKVIVR